MAWGRDMRPHAEVVPASQRECCDAVLRIEGENA